MAFAVGVRFKPVSKTYWFNPGPIELKAGDKVIVETSKGLELGVVAIEPKNVPDECVVPPLRNVLRLADEGDLRTAEENQRKAAEALDICRAKAREKGLEMEVLEAEYTFDRSKLTFYFASDGRVDFRELVKELASIFKARIEMRQIGVRDEAKALGGIGPCGREVCCALFLSEFKPVSIKMAKGQSLSLNPTKISGLCGRLMCCLRYEQDRYRGEKGRERQNEEPGGEPPEEAEYSEEKRDEGQTSD